MSPLHQGRAGRRPEGHAGGGQHEVRFSYTARATAPLRSGPFIDNAWERTMVTERAADRIAIDGKIHCRSADGDDRIVLRWCRQVDEAAPSEPARWVAAGTAVFTLLDASAVIQIGGSMLQVVATGEVLHVVEDIEDGVGAMPAPLWAGAAADHARPAAAMN
jgi:hypothetical protein